VQADDLDQGEDLRLRSAQADGPAAHAEAPGEQGQVDHHRRVGEHQLAEVDDDISLGADSASYRGATDALRRPVLVTAAAQRCDGVIEIDDGGKLHKPTCLSQGLEP
jgi:hypothetical protein